MAREKILVHKVRMTERNRNIIHQLLGKYNIQTAKELRKLSEISLVEQSWK